MELLFECVPVRICECICAGAQLCTSVCMCMRDSNIVAYYSSGINTTPVISLNMVMIIYTCINWLLLANCTARKVDFSFEYRRFFSIKKNICLSIVDGIAAIQTKFKPKRTHTYIHIRQTPKSLSKFKRPYDQLDDMTKIESLSQVFWAAFHHTNELKNVK